MKYLVKFEIEADEDDIEQIVADMQSEISYDGGECLKDSF